MNQPLSTLVIPVDDIRRIVDLGHTLHLEQRSTDALGHDRWTDVLSISTEGRATLPYLFLLGIIRLWRTQPAQRASPRTATTPKTTRRPPAPAPATNNDRNPTTFKTLSHGIR